jgi:hypothetical protein
VKKISLDIPRVNGPRVAHTPRIPAGLGGIAELHAAFLKESRTRHNEWCRVQESGYLSAHFAPDMGHPGSSATEKSPSEVSSRGVDSVLIRPATPLPD